MNKVEFKERTGYEVSDADYQVDELQGRINSLEKEQLKIAETIIEQAFEYTSLDLRGLAIRIMGEREYLLYLIKTERTFWIEDLALIKKYLNK